MELQVEVQTHTLNGPFGFSEAVCVTVPTWHSVAVTTVTVGGMSGWSSMRPAAQGPAVVRVTPSVRATVVCAASHTAEPLTETPGMSSQKFAEVALTK